MHNIDSRLLWCLLPLIGMTFMGCGNGDRPPLGNVSGTVTMDGEPLVGVIVTFKPTNGRPAVGVTDATGKYQLEYSRGVKGTKVGSNTVGFSWPIGVAGSHEIPARYSGKSDLEQEVESGCNSFDFDLESDPDTGKKKPAPAPTE